MKRWNLKLWIALYLPSFLGKEVMVAWLGSLLKPFKTLFSSFRSFQISFNSGLQYNSQSIVLEHILNDLFDSDDRRIRVINQELLFVPRFHYSISEHEADPDLSLYNYFQISEAHSPYFFFFSREQESAQYSFLVSFPEALVFDRNALRATVNFRKLAGIRYKLVKVENDLITPIEFLTQEYE